MKRLLCLVLVVVLCIGFSGCKNSQETPVIDDATGIVDQTESKSAKPWEEEYGEIPSSREVQYDKYKYLGRPFVISGTAAIDDYFNYDYRGLEAVYFCICIQPTGGSYSDCWYVYADRLQFKELFDSLLEGNKKVDLVAEMYYADTGSNNMATLRDYY